MDKKRGRPKKLNCLTPAQKQASYRLRCAGRVQTSLTFEYQVFLELKNALDQVENRYPLRAGRPAAPERKAALFALEELRRALIDKSNVTKI